MQNGGLFSSICDLMGKYAAMGAHVRLRLSSWRVMCRMAAHREPCVPDKGIYNPHWHDIQCMSYYIILMTM